MDDIIVVDYDPRWPLQFQEEVARVRDAMGGEVVLEHVGSTAVPGLAAKPIIDIVAFVPSLAAGERATPALEAIGYEACGAFGIPGRLFFRKGRIGTPRTHHLHLYEPGHENARDNIIFRDYLRAHPKTVSEYAALKRSLAAKFHRDRDAYTDAKTEFIQSVLQRALLEKNYAEKS